MSEISSAELAEWQAFDRMEPFGERVADQRHGILTSVLANVHRDPKKRPEGYEPNDFIYWHESNRKKREAQFIADPDRQSALISRTLFRKVKKPQR